MALKVTFLRCLGMLWALPGSVVGLILAIFLKPTGVFWLDGTLIIDVRRLFPGWAKAQTWGWVILVREYSARLIAHERIHVRHSMKWGPLLAIAYPLATLFAMMAGGHYYHDNVFEIVAYRESRNA